jgi:hypothetical protein
LFCIGLDDAAALGVLSSRIHLEWALAAGGRLGVGNDPRYNKSRSFDPFPFPAVSPSLHRRLAATAEALDNHRKAALGRDERITMTGMYNVVGRLRSGEHLTREQREIHEIAACGVLRDLHDELDAQVAQAYGWPWPMAMEEILERLVALHDERVEEERLGKVRWLRPDYQLPRFGEDLPGGGELALEARLPGKSSLAEPAVWPATAADQISVLKRSLDQTPRSPAELAARLKGARTDLVERHLDTLALLAEVRRLEDGRFVASSQP